MSPYSALALLCLFKQGKMSLTVSQFDECQDALITLLEEVNDEKHRLRSDTIPDQEEA